MQFLTYAQAASQPFAMQYRYRAAGTAILLVADLGLAVASAVQAAVLWKQGRLLGVALLGWCALWFAVFGLVLYNVLANRLRPSNWLARLQSDGILLKYRSYLNSPLPVDDLVAISLPFSEIEWAREQKLDRNIPGATTGDDERRFQRYVALKLRNKADLIQLEGRLAAERQAAGQKIRTWYGSRNRGVSRHYPVSTAAGGIVRVEWDVKPGIADFLRRIQPLTSVAAAAQQSIDYRAATTVNPNQQREMLLELLSTGDRMGAIKAARHLYGFDLNRAVAFIEELSAQKPRDTGSPN